MRKHLSLFILLFSLAKVHAQQVYTITGTVKNMPVDSELAVHLYYPNGGDFYRSTCKVAGGKFTFKGEISQTQQAFLLLAPAPQDFNDAIQKYGTRPGGQIAIYLEKGNIKATLDYKTLEQVVITGTPNNDAYQKARTFIWKFKERQKDTSVTAYYKLVDERNKAVGQFVKTNPAKLASLDLLRRWVNPIDNFAEGKTYFAYLDTSLQHTRNGVKYKDLLEQASKLSIGAIAPDFTLPDTAGYKYTLSHYRGRYVLVDFWASWCAPCRKENPNLIKAYAAYKGKNFQIVGVSLDDNKDKWMAAIKKDGITWPQISELGGWNSAVAQQYMLNAIPANFLLDTSGKIIAKNLRGEELEAALKELPLKNDTLLLAGWDMKPYTFMDSSGHDISIKDFAGKYVFLDIWASWCRPCINEFPSFDSLKQVRSGKDIEFIQLSCDVKDWRWRSGIGWTKRNGHQWFINGNEQFMHDLRIAYIPRYLLIDRKGIVIKPFMSKPSAAETDKILSML